MVHATAPFLDEKVAAGDGARIAIETPAARVTYAELTDLATRLAAADWADMLADSRARVLVADAGLAKPLLDHAHRFPHLRVVVASSSLAELRASVSPALPTEPVGPDDMAFWLYTSGTTGGPKAVVHLHRDLLACRHDGGDVLGVGPDDRVFATSKLFFAYALGTALLIPLSAGARTWLEPAWPAPDGVHAVLRSFAPTLFFSVPTFYARLLRADVPRDAFRSVRAAVSAGERLPAEVHGAFRAALRRRDPPRARHDRDHLHGALESSGRQPAGVGRLAGAGHRRASAGRWRPRRAGRRARRPPRAHAAPSTGIGRSSRAGHSSGSGCAPAT